MTRKRSAISDHRSAITLASSRSSSRAFTLVELVVVIGIIVVLAAIVLGVAGALGRKSDADRTRNVLKLLDMALGEWENAADRQMSWGFDGEPLNMKYELHSRSAVAGVGTAEMATSDLLSKLRNATGSKDIMAKIDPKLLIRREDPPPARTLIRDPWDKEIIIVHPGRLPNPLINSDPVAPDPLRIDLDGTIRTGTTGNANIDPAASEIRFGECVNRRICFVSAGPDGDFGDLHLDIAQGSLTPQQQKEVDLAADNIYSYPLLQERAP